MRAILRALLSLSLALSQSYELSDAPGFGREFVGVGAISGGGATSRLLLDYVEPQRSEILDYLFLPSFGASLQILKVEIGGGADTTNGAEPPHRYAAPGVEPAVWTRGYESWLCVEAKKRNPDIQLYALPWAFPGFLQTTPNSQTPFGNNSATAAYVVEWLSGMRDVYNLTFDYQGLFNEKSTPGDYVVTLRAALDDAGFSATKIVASDDGGWPYAPIVLENATVAAAVWGLGSHYPGASSSAQAKQTGLPLLASEDNSKSCLAGDNGGACWARLLNENVAHANITGSISWSLINSWFAGIEFFGDGLMNAVSPWSGSYYVGAPIWASAHYTQFTAPGFKYLQAGSGVGYLTHGGTYSTLLNPADTSQWTLVVEKQDRAGSQCSWSSSPPNVTTSETATFTLGGSLAGVASLHAWRSTFALDGSADPAAMFAYVGALPVVGGAISIDVNVGDLWTLSTIATARKGAHATPPPDAPFPLPWVDSFDTYNLTSESKYMSDMNGNFEIVDTTPFGRAGGRALRQMTIERPIVWLRSDTTPHAIIGDPSWAALSVRVDVLVQGAGESAALAVGCAGLDVCNTTCFWLVVSAAAANATSGTWAVYGSTGTMSTPGWRPAAGGALPAGAPLLPGAWHTLGIDVSGAPPLANLSWDGGALAALLPLAVADAPAAGFVGIGTAAYGHHTLFDNLAIRPLPQAPCAAAAAAGALLATQPCSGARNGTLAAFQFAPVAGGPNGQFASTAQPALCIAVNASDINPLTGAPLLTLARCADAGAAALWSPPSTADAGGFIRSALTGSCMEVSKRNPALGTPLEVWACGDSPGAALNQIWRAANGQLQSLLNAEPQCAGVCA